MLLATLSDLLKTTNIEGCNLQLTINNGQPILVVKFNKAGSSSTDSEPVQKLRKSLATPLLIQFDDEDVESNNMDEAVVAELGHISESIGDAVQQLKLVATKTPKSKKTKTKPVKEPQSATVTKVAPQTIEATKTVATVQPALGFNLASFKL